MTAQADSGDSRVVIQTADFSQDAVYQAMRKKLGAAVGAVVTFVGLVRERNAQAGSGEVVDTLTLEHYPGMTEASIARILEQAEARWPVLDCHVIHRVGTMRPAEQIVLVAVASAHRDAAFAAAEFVMDYLKTDAVFWKREVADGSAHWVESTDQDRQRADTWQQK
ncbi:MAG: molybdenum cofactor biosynthesis protein MoaE [Pseudomonadota bacterium]